MLRISRSNNGRASMTAGRTSLNMRAGSSSLPMYSMRITAPGLPERLRHVGAGAMQHRKRRVLVADPRFEGQRAPEARFVRDGANLPRLGSAHLARAVVGVVAKAAHIA